MLFIIVYFLEMQGWKPPQEAISGIPLLQAGQRATSWDQLVFILFILEPFEEGSRKLFLTEPVDSPLGCRSLGWVKSSWVGQSLEQCCSGRFLPWGLSSYPVFAMQLLWLRDYMFNLNSVVTCSDPFVHTSDRTSSYLGQGHSFFFPQDKWVSKRRISRS